MNKSIAIRMGGYGPATTGFSRALKFIGDRLEAEFGDRLDIKYVWNIMDLGYEAQDILWLVEHGVLTLGYQSSSYLTDRIPDLGLLDLPFLFETTDAARAAIDGKLGRVLARRIEERETRSPSSAIFTSTKRRTRGGPSRPQAARSSSLLPKSTGPSSRLCSRSMLKRAENTAGICWSSSRQTTASHDSYRERSQISSAAFAFPRLYYVPWIMCHGRNRTVARDPGYGAMPRIRVKLARTFSCVSATK